MDWVVLAALVVGTGLSAMTLTGRDFVDLAVKIDTRLGGMSADAGPPGRVAAGWAMDMEGMDDAELLALARWSNGARANGGVVGLDLGALDRTLDRALASRDLSRPRGGVPDARALRRAGTALSLAALNG